MKPSHRDPNIVSASEIGSWAYCPEQWRLHYGLGLATANRIPLDHGERFHDKTATVERRTGAARRVGWWFLVLAALFVAIAAFFLRT